MDLNRVMIIGRATTNVDIKKIANTGGSVVNFTLVTNNKYKNKEGDIVEEATFHRCVAFGNLADILGKYLEKGKRLYLEGRLRTRKWEDTNGTTRYTTEIVTENFRFLDSKGTNKDLDNEIAQNSQTEEDLPF